MTGGTGRDEDDRAADRAEVVRIHSASGTTGTPSCIPPAAEDLVDWTQAQ